MTPEEYKIMVEVYADAKRRFRDMQNVVLAKYIFGEVVGIKDLVVKLLSDHNQINIFEADSERRMIEMDGEI